MTEQQEVWDGEDRRAVNPLRQQIRNQSFLLATIVVCFAIMMGAVSYGVTQEARNRQESRVFGEQLLGCILAVQAQQQENSRISHDEIANALGTSIERPSGTTTPEDLTISVKDACEGFAK